MFQGLYPLDIPSNFWTNLYSYIINLILLGIIFYLMVFFFIDLQNDTTHNALHVQIGTKRCVMNEDSSTLWHRRLGHISVDRIKRLVNNEILSTLDSIAFNTCVDCIKDK